ncbi:hypothetical protein [Streptomyces sp. NPDC047869]|uniref:hypothetical protein n=1 Tax=Streptomyces sp. NPDC047869 TaxID=3154709 RepID=UPI00345236C5
MSPAPLTRPAVRERGGDGERHGEHSGRTGGHPGRDRPPAGPPDVRAAAAGAAGTDTDDTEVHWCRRVTDRRRYGRLGDAVAGV